MEPLILGIINTEFGMAKVIRCAYMNNLAMAIQLVDANTEEPIATFSTNLQDPAHDLQPGEFFAKTWSENEPLTATMLECGLFKDTGIRESTGFVEAQVWKLIPIEAKPAYMACGVQDACNSSGVLHSFMRLLENGAGWANPLVIMYGSKLCSMAGQFDGQRVVKKVSKWSDVANMGHDVLTAMTGLDTDAKAQLEVFQEFCRELKAWTLCNDHNVTEIAFNRMVIHADWTGKEDERNRFMRTYCSNMVNDELRQHAEA